MEHTKLSGWPQTFERQCIPLPLRNHNVLTLHSFSPIKVPTAITTMKISSKRVSMSARLIFVTFAQAKRNENASSEEKVRHVQLRRLPVMIHIVKPSEGDNEERRTGGKAFGASLSVRVVLKCVASRTCYDIAPQTERLCFTRPDSKPLIIRATTATWGGYELNLLPGDPERVGCIRFYFTRIAQHPSGFVKVCGS